MIKEIKWFIQRGKRGYADCDIWDFDSYLCRIIVPALRQLKEDSFGCPSEMYDKKAKNDECHRWSEALEEMAQGFEANEELHKPRFFLKDGEKKLDLEQIKQLNEKMQRGLGLFVKYFGSLWD